MGLYYCLDFIGTLTEALFLYTFNHCFLKQPRFTTPICKWITPTMLFALSWLLTWFSELGAYKTIFLIACIFIVLKLCYKDSIYQMLTAMEIWFMSVCLFPEAMGMAVATWIYGDGMIILVEGQKILRWEVYIVIFLIRLTAAFVSYQLVKNIRYKIQLKDCFTLTFTFLIGFSIYILVNYNYLNLSRVVDIAISVSGIVLSLTFYITFIYAKNTLYLREQEQKDKMQIAQLQQQFAYYQERLKDEEKVRFVYHDMKNHLLVLQRQINSPETAEMVEKLQSQVAMYGKLICEYTIRITGNQDILVLSPQIIGRLIEKIRCSDTKELIIPADELLPQGYAEYLERVMQTNNIEKNIGRQDAYDLTAKQIGMLKVKRQQCFDKAKAETTENATQFNLETNESFFLLTKQSDSRFVCDYENGEKIVVSLDHFSIWWQTFINKRTVEILIKSLKVSQEVEDLLVYPIVYNARHSIELSLKIVIKMLWELERKKKISHLVEFIVERKKKLHTHNIEELYKMACENKNIDRRIPAYFENIEDMIQFYYFDEEGDAFKYELNKDDQPHMIKNKISHISIELLETEFKAVMEKFDDLIYFLGSCVDEYSLGTFTKSLSRTDIGEISKKLPFYEEWRTEKFKEVKDQIKQEYQLGSKELTDALNLIKKHRLFSSNIGFRIYLFCFSSLAIQHV